MIAYADSSFLGSLYGTDTNSFRAIAEYLRLKPRLQITPFGGLELTDAFEVRVFRKEITPSQCEQSLRTFRDDLDSGLSILSIFPR